MDYTYYDQRLETLPPEQLRALQVDKLRVLLDEIYGRNRFYTSRLDAAGVGPSSVETLDDLGRLPMTTKADLLAAQSEGGGLGSNATYPEDRYTRFHQTSGTTGEPLRVLDTSHSWSWWSHCWAIILGASGLTASDRLFLPFSFGPFIGFWATVGGAENIGAMMIPGGGRGSPERLHLMADLGVTAMCSTPTYALRLGEVAREDGGVIRHPAELKLNDQERKVLDAVESEPTDIDLVAVRTELPVPRVLATISVLEIRHLIRRVSGSRVVRQ